MHRKSITEIAEDLRAKRYSSVELTQTFLTRINQFDRKLNSFITVTEEAALKAALNADKRLADGTATPLTGIPIAHKDSFCTEGVKTSCASKMLDNFIAPYSATIVERAADAGMVLLGKTNLDEFAMGTSNETSFYGPTLNPWDCKLVPGGSSGGSTAAVAARLVPAATGSDTGGSIRQPAAFCGVMGLKPTYGRVSRHGMIAFTSSFDQAGPICHSAADMALLLNVMAGFDPKDSSSVTTAAPDYSATLNESIKGLKIGLPAEFFGAGLDSGIAVKIEAAICELKKLGATVQEIELPRSQLAIPTYYIIAPAECASNLARFDGIRFGHRCSNPVNIDDLYARSRAEGFGSEVKRRIMIGTYILSKGYIDEYYLKAQKVRQLIRQDFQAAFEKVDIILGPTTPTPPFALGGKVHDPISMYLNDIYTSPVNLAGLPALSMPAGFTEGLPVGMQLIGNYFAEAKLLNVAHRYQQVTDWHRQVPKIYPAA
ncbi:MAG: Asp-tRNA(Asn)/Glu-tRNA(Gln) amidotransferase subunit GatA [Gammaproteobacteria bacterium]|nr:Asp-tRNA(Asn)/Glu-tRNA(Gln) amidotransferase subunit GatA [Gammaproteobacteria bacterium]